MKYLVSFDLKRPEQNYAKVEKKLKEIGGKKVLHTQWLVDRDLSVGDFLVHLRSTFNVFDSNDRILILKIPDGRGAVILGVSCQNLLSNMDRTDFY